MPIYEYRCGECGGRFEALVPIGTETSECRICAADGATRVLSEPAPPPRLVKTGAGYRRQEEKNRQLRDQTKRDFKRKMDRRRAAAKTRKGGSG